MYKPTEIPHSNKNKKLHVSYNIKEAHTLYDERHIPDLSFLSPNQYLAKDKTTHTYEKKNEFILFNFIFKKNRCGEVYLYICNLLNQRDPRLFHLITLSNENINEWIICPALMENIVNSMDWPFLFNYFRGNINIVEIFYMIHKAFAFCTKSMNEMYIKHEFLLEENIESGKNDEIRIADMVDELYKKNSVTKKESYLKFYANMIPFMNFLKTEIRQKIYQLFLESISELWAPLST